MIQKKLKEKGIELANHFVKNILKKESWFVQLEQNSDFDLLVLTGSVVQGGKDKLSDLDFFLLTTLENQKKYELKPVYEYEYKGVHVEISNVTTEKLLSDQHTKNHIYWWKDSVIILGDTKKYDPILNKAGSYSEIEKKEKLWSLMALFEMNIIDLERIIERNDEISFELNYWDCIKIFSEYMLLLKDIYKRFKWYGKLMKDHYPKIYQEMQKINKETDFEYRLSCLKNLRIHLQSGLIENGFSKEEVKDWHNNNLTLLLVQRQ
ncbi:MAG: hypothetical protein ACMXX8_00635 [Candidatus Woesearchaeota archaeon]